MVRCCMFFSFLFTAVFMRETIKIYLTSISFHSTGQTFFPYDGMRKNFILFNVRLAATITLTSRTQTMTSGTSLTTKRRYGQFVTQHQCFSLLGFILGSNYYKFSNDNSSHSTSHLTVTQNFNWESTCDRTCINRTFSVF